MLSCRSSPAIIIPSSMAFTFSCIFCCYFCQNSKIVGNIGTAYFREENVNSSQGSDCESLIILYYYLCVKYLLFGIWRKYSWKNNQGPWEKIFWKLWMQIPQLTKLPGRGENYQLATLILAETVGFARCLLVWTLGVWASCCYNNLGAKLMCVNLWITCFAAMTETMQIVGASG